MATLQRKIAGQGEEQRDAVWQRRVGRLKRRRWTRRLTNAFIVWQIFATAVWLMPSNWPVVHSALPPNGAGPVRAYMTGTNFMQAWLMFAPEPDGTDLWVEARILYADGTTKTWLIPRMRDMGYVDRYRHERLRKWVEVASRNYLVWPSLARYAARSNNHDPRNPPRAVTLLMHVHFLAPPGKPAIPVRVVDLCKVWMRPEDLQ